MDTFALFKLKGKVAVITGGAGLLGEKHADVVAEAGGVPVLWDINPDTLQSAVDDLAEKQGVQACNMVVDITDPESIKAGLSSILAEHKKVDILINNAANDPKVNTDEKISWSRLENFDLAMWKKDIAVGLTGAYLCSQIIGTHMADKAGGVILNIASDLGVIAPDQRIYRKPGIEDHLQPVKPVTYSVVKHGIIGLTKYLATYWAEKNIRVNAISPGGIFNQQPDDFMNKLTNLIPLGRMADKDEYKAAILFLVSEASSYMTGANLIIDGGRTCW
jgi:NAD(P)-dependent dehydrogenase (short-subunit alcohol dehydrogenase family)